MSSPDAPEDRPVLLLGAERSGTTLLGLMLGGHPQISWAGEFEYVLEVLPEAPGFPELSGIEERLALDRRFRAQRLAVEPVADYPALVRSFLRQIRQRKGKPQVGATLHAHFDRIPRIWEEPRVLHLVRDGRDVALSRVRMGWAGTPWTAVHTWIQAEEQWDRIAPSLPAGSWLELRFEDLVRDPRATLTRICAFLGLEFSDAMLRYSEHSRYAPPDPQLAGQWQRRMGPRQLAWIEYRAGSLLVRRGYALSGAPVRAPRLAERCLAGTQDRAARLQARLRRFGLGLVLAEFLARRLGLEPLRRRIQLRIDALTERSLL